MLPASITRLFSPDIKISVIIPTCRRPALLDACLRALYRQSLEKTGFEVIVVSDGPDEQTRKAMAKWTAKKNWICTFLELAEKKGPAASRNRGWLMAKGNLVAFTDDDCIPDKNWLYACCSAYAGKAEIAFSAQVRVPLPPSPTDHALNTSHLEKAEFITANCVCTKHALLKIGGFDERFALAWREDSDLLFKLIVHKIPVYKIQAAVTHPVREAAWGISIREQKKGMFNALLYKKYPDLYRGKIQSRSPLNYYVFISSFAGILIGLALQSGLSAFISLLVWLILLIHFTIRRLATTSRSAGHVSEMLITSMVIPFLSVYWQFYGAVKYRVLFV